MPAVRLFNHFSFVNSNSNIQLNKLLLGGVALGGTFTVGREGYYQQQRQKLQDLAKI